MKFLLVIMLTTSYVLAAEPPTCLVPDDGQPLAKSPTSEVANYFTVSEGYLTTCQKELTCLDKIRLQLIRTRLADAEKNGTLTEAEFSKITDKVLASAEPASVQRVGRALLAEGLANAKIAPHDAQLIATGIQANGDLKTELESFAAEAKSFGSYLDEFQSSADASYATRLGRFFSYGTSATVDALAGTDTMAASPLSKHAQAYIVKANQLTEKTKNYLAKTTLSPSEKSKIVTALQTQISQVGITLSQKVTDAGSSLQTAQIPLVGAAGLLGAGGLVTAFVASVPEATLAYFGMGGFSSLGGTGAVTSTLAGGGVAGHGAGLALSGATYMAVSTEGKRLIEAFAHSDGSRSSMCKIADSFTNLTPAQEGIQIAQGTALGTIIGGGLMGMIAKGGRWAVAGTAAGIGLFGVGTERLYSEYATAGDLYQDLRKQTDDPTKLSCIDRAIAVAKTEAGFDVVTFIASILGPQAFERWKASAAAKPKALPVLSVVQVSESEAEALAIQVTSSAAAPEVRLPTARARELIGQYQATLQKWLPSFPNAEQHPYLIAILDALDAKAAKMNWSRETVIEKFSTKLQRAICACGACPGAMNEKLFGLTWANRIASSGLPKCQLERNDAM